jgi:NADH:ubiquinone oxidoreductase subunit 6 (subunit J)
MRRLIIAAIVIAVLIIMLLTNPSRDSHMEAIRERQSGLAEAGLTVAADFLGAFEYNNYGLFSTVSSGDDTVSFGIFGGVWVDEE